LGLRLAQERRDFTELKKGKTNVGVVLASSILLGWYIPMLLVIYTLRKTWGFSERHYSLKDFSCFFRFWSWLKDRISLSERLVFFFVFFFIFVFFILKDFQLIQKDLLFLILKDIFHQKDLDVKERHEISSERHEFLFSERLGCCNFLQKDL
jgi:hypothetical protein